MRKKLLIIHPSIAPYRVDYFNYLYDSFDCEIILWLKKEDSHVINYSEFEKQFHFKPLYMNEMFGKIKLPKGLYSEIKRIRPDIILCSEFNPTTMMSVIYKYLCNHKCKVITMMDDSYDMVTGGANFSLKHILGRNLLLPVLDQVICVEPCVELFLQNKYRKGFTFPVITEDKRFRERLRYSLPVSEQYVEKYSLKGKKVLLYVGRLIDLKNVQKVIPLFLKLNSADYVFVIVGDGPMAKELKDLSRNSKNIIFTGKLEGAELFAWYNIAQLFILPSYLEPFGAVTNEALLGGCHSLVSSKAGSQSLIESGINGEIIDPNSDDDILQKLNLSFNKSSPVCPPLSLRESLMQKTFNDYMNLLLVTLNK